MNILKFLCNLLLELMFIENIVLSLLKSKIYKKSLWRHPETTDPLCIRWFFGVSFNDVVILFTEEMF